jgi:hypothetical protein
MPVVTINSLQQGNNLKIKHEEPEGSPPYHRKSLKKVVEFFIGCVKGCRAGIILCLCNLSLWIFLKVNSMFHAQGRDSRRRECTLRQIYAKD